MTEYEQSAKGPVVTPARVIAAICVAVPFVAVLWVPIFDKDKPELGGFPFFFWWQLLWVAITAALMGLAYYVVRREEVARKGASTVGNAAAPSAAGTAEAAAEAQNAEESTQQSAEGTAGEGAAEDEGTAEGPA